jgi:nucleoid DNA-binding protein
MEQEIKGKSRIKSIVNEIAYDLGIDKKLVRQVLLLTFKEIAVTLLLRGRPVMIRRFVKFVVAAAAIKKAQKTKQKEKLK